MKIRNLTMCSVVSLILSFGCAVAFGQRRLISAEEFYSTNRDTRMYSQVAAKPSTGTKLSTTVATPGPGDNFLAFLHTSALFVNNGDSLIAKMVFVRDSKDYAEGVSIYGRMLVPGPSGRYDTKGEIRYINLEDGFNGTFSSILAGQTLRVYQTVVSADMPDGEYLLDFVISSWDGTLIQQVFARYYVRRTGPYGKGTFFLNSGRVAETLSSGDSLGIVEGQLPVDSKMEVFAGIPSRSSITTQGITSLDGTELKFVMPHAARYNQSTERISPADVTVFIPWLRECITLPHAFEWGILETN